MWLIEMCVRACIKSDKEELAGVLPLKRSTVPILQRLSCVNSSPEEGVQWPNMQNVLLLSDDRLDFLGCE